MIIKTNVIWRENHLASMKKTAIITLAFLAVSLYANRGMAIKTDTKPKEVQKIMNNEQPFSNPQRNSLLPYNLSAKGTLAWRFEYNPDNFAGNASSLLMFDDTRAVLDYSSLIFAIDISNQKVLGYRRKSENAFIVLADYRNFYSFEGYRLIKLDIDDIQADVESYFVPGLGDYSRLELFIPKQDTFIVGIQGTGDPIHNEAIFGLLEKQYKIVRIFLWNISFDGFATMPPVSADGNFVVAMDNSIKIIGIDGNIKKEFEGKFIPTCCSIGVDGIIYLMCKTESEYVIRAMDFECNIIWECSASITIPTQPPVVSNDSMVYLIDSSKIEAFLDGEMLWEFDLADDNSPKLASVTNDGMLLVTNGRFINCLNKAGEVVWTFRWNKEEKFMTQPILDSTGKVIVATDKKILAIE